jgi:hypothetical protein
MRKIELTIVASIALLGASMASASEKLLVQKRRNDPLLNRMRRIERCYNIKALVDKVNRDLAAAIKKREKQDKKRSLRQLKSLN